MSLLQSNAFDANTTLFDIDGDDATLRGLCGTGTTHDLDEVACSNLLHPGIASGGHP
jgi:hypothetical protein